MALAYYRLAQEQRGYGDVGAFDQIKQLPLQAKSVQLHAGDNDRPLGPVYHGNCLFKGFLQGDLVACFLDLAQACVVACYWKAGDIARELDVGRHLVAQQRVPFSLSHPRSPAYHNNRGFFRVRLRGRIYDLEAADGVGNADRPKAVDAGVGICRYPCALLVAGVDHLEQVAADELVVKSKDIVAGDAENVADAVRIELLDEIFTDADQVNVSLLRQSIVINISC